MRQGSRDKRTRNFTSVFGDRTSFRAKGWRRTTCKRQFYLSFLAIEPHFVRKGCAGQLANGNFTSVFGDRTSFRAKKVAIWTPWNRNFTDRTSFRAKGLRGDNLQTAILPQFLAIEPHFVRKGCAGQVEIATVFGDRTSFRAKGLRFVPSRWHCPAPSREKEKRRRWQEGKRTRGEDVKMWGCGDEQMWGWEDVKMSRCEDEQMWRWEDVKMSKCEDVRMWKWEDVKMWRGEDEQMWRWEAVKMRRCEDVRMRRYEDEQMWRWEDVKVWGCEGEDVRMWGWEDVKMRRCEDEKMRRWEDVKMRRCFTDPHYWKNPALRRAREKRKHQMAKQGSPPLLLEIAATVRPISSSLHVQWEGQHSSNSHSSWKRWCLGLNLQNIPSGSLSERET